MRYALLLGEGLQLRIGARIERGLSGLTERCLCIVLVQHVVAGSYRMIGW